MKLGKKTVVTIGVLLSALLCVNMILYTPASADGNTKLKTSKNDISSETVNMHQGVSMSYAQIVQTYSDEYLVSLYSELSCICMDRKTRHMDAIFSAVCVRWQL